MEKIKILIVEDEIFIARDLQMSLEKMGITVISIVPSGEQAIQKAGEDRPDIVLMDIVLQDGMDGIEAAEIIHSDFDIPVIYLTAHGDKAIFERAKKTEPFGYITKPFKDNDLKRAIDIAIFNQRIKVDERMHTEEQIRKLSRAVEQSSSTVMITDTNAIIEYVNPKFAQLTGYTCEDAIGQNPRIMKSGNTPPEEYERLWHNITSGREWHGEFCNKKKNGELYWESASISPVRNTEGTITHFVAVKEDITERKKTEKILQKQKKALEKKNIALSEILGQIELEKKQIKNNVIANAENLLLPIIEKLGLKDESSKYAQLLRKNLQELTSSFGAKLTEKGTKLTSREIEICNMIRNGLTSKEIGSLLNISLQTIEKHRSHIRKKLGIVNEKLNLSSVLKTL